MKYRVTLEVKQEVEEVSPVDAIERLANSLTVGLLRVRPTFGNSSAVDENGTVYLFGERSE